MSEDKPFDNMDVRCDAKGTHNFVLGTHARVGHLLEMSFPNGGKDLIADTTVYDPMDPEAKVKIAGVFDYIAWEGGPTDPIKFTLRVSGDNKAILQEALSSLTGGSEIDMKYAIYEYDAGEDKYFKNFHTDDKKVKFVITKGTKIIVNADANTDVKEPKNYNVSGSLTAKSKGEEQQLTMAYMLKSPFARRFGSAPVA